MGDDYNYQHENNYQAAGIDIKKIITVIVVVIGIFILFSFISNSTRKKIDPINKFITELRNNDEFSVVLIDMMEDGFIFKTYYHQYEITTANKTDEFVTNVSTNEKIPAMKIDKSTTDWIEVSSKTYKNYYDKLGMSIVAKNEDGEIVRVAQPEVYRYVGNRNYGYWSGTQWFFFPRYSLYGWRDPAVIITRDSYNNYRNYANTGQTYFGANREYGTAGTVTKQRYTNSNIVRTTTSSNTFADRFTTKQSRTSTTTRSTASSTRSSGGK